MTIFHNFTNSLTIVIKISILNVAGVPGLTLIIDIFALQHLIFISLKRSINFDGKEDGWLL